MRGVRQVKLRERSGAWRMVDLEAVRRLKSPVTLQAIKETWLGELDDSALTSQKLVEFAQWRMGQEGGGVLCWLSFDLPTRTGGAQGVCCTS